MEDRLKKLYLHIGPHKTASTYIQKVFHKNIDTLEKVGIIYPLFDTDHMYGQHSLVDDIRFRKKLILENKVEYINQLNKDIFLSSENFVNLNFDDIKYFSSFLKNFDVEIIFLKRKIDDLLVSLWQERIKHGGKDSWVMFLFHHMNEPVRSKAINPCRVLDLYADVFHKEKIKIIDFDYAIESKVDICDLVFKIIRRTELEGIGIQKKINISFDFDEIEIIRMFNILYSRKNSTQINIDAKKEYLKFKKVNPNHAIIFELKNIIQKSMKPVSINDTLLFKKFDNDFITNYSSCIVNFKENIKTKKSVRDLPDDNWLINFDAMNYINILYEEIFGVLETPQKSDKILSRFVDYLKRIGK